MAKGKSRLILILIGSLVLIGVIITPLFIIRPREYKQLKKTPSIPTPEQRIGRVMVRGRIDVVNRDKFPLSPARTVVVSKVKGGRMVVLLGKKSSSLRELKGRLVTVTGDPMPKMEVKGVPTMTIEVRTISDVEEMRLE